jgi:putative protein-disulfide isomerase
MCSWCYGFAPQLAALLDGPPGTELELVMGGLRAGNRVPMDAARRAEIRGHWSRVAALSGQPFAAGEDAMARPGFVYDTEPACRAVVTARVLEPLRAHRYLDAVHVAFYRDARDTTDAGILADIAAETGLDRAQFASAFASDSMKRAAEQDFARVQRWGIGGFPTLLAERERQWYLVASGYTDVATLRVRLDTLGQG